MHASQHTAGLLATFVAGNSKHSQRLYGSQDGISFHHRFWKEKRLNWVKNSYSVNSKSLQHVNHIFSGDIPRSSLCIRTAAQSCHRGIHHADSFLQDWKHTCSVEWRESYEPTWRKWRRSSADLQSYEDVSESLAVGVVAVYRQGADRHLPHDNVQHLTHAARSAHPDGVAEGDLVAAHGVQPLGDLREDRRRSERSKGCGRRRQVGLRSSRGGLRVRLFPARRCLRTDSQGRKRRSCGSKKQGEL